MENYLRYVMKPTETSPRVQISNRSTGELVLEECSKLRRKPESVFTLSGFLLNSIYVRSKFLCRRCENEEKTWKTKCVQDVASSSTTLVSIPVVKGRTAAHIFTPDTRVSFQLKVWGTRSTRREHTQTQGEHENPTKRGIEPGCEATMLTTASPCRPHCERLNSCCDFVWWTSAGLGAWLEWRRILMWSAIFLQLRMHKAALRTRPRCNVRRRVQPPLLGLVGSVLQQPNEAAAVWNLSRYNETLDGQNHTAECGEHSITMNYWKHCSNLTPPLETPQADALLFQPSLCLNFHFASVDLRWVCWV